MADSERPSTAGDGRRVPGDKEAAAFQDDDDACPEVVDSLPEIASHYALRATGGTLSADTSCVRALNNFVKACVLDVTVRAVVMGGHGHGHNNGRRRRSSISVADIACGRGQDFPKWMHALKAAGARLDAFYGMDAADTRVHLHEKAQRYLAQVTDGPIVTRMGDMSKRFEGCADGSMDVVSAQLCLHYLCDDVTRLETFFKECARVLTRTGVLLVSYADGRAIVRRGRNALTAAPSPAYTVAVRGAYHAIVIPSMHLRANTASPWGCRYTFSLADSVCGVPEFLCHEGSVCAVARRVAGFLAGPSMSFDDAATSLLAKPYYNDIAVKMRWFDFDISIENRAHIFDTASLYRVAVFSRSTTSLQEWQQALLQFSGGGGDSRAECETTSTQHPSSPRLRRCSKMQKL